MEARFHGELHSLRYILTYSKNTKQALTEKNKCQSLLKRK